LRGAVVLAAVVAGSVLLAGGGAGVGRAGAGGAAVAAVSALGAGPAIEPQVCSSCAPPVTSAGGPVLATNGLTVTPIYWQPSGGSYAFPAVYETVLNGYIANVAAASGSADNVYSIDTEYYDKSNRAKTYVTYKIKAGTPIVDGDPFPPNGCMPASGYTACITDDQLRTELAKVVSAHGLPTDLAHYYPVFFPPKVETKDRDGTTSAGDFCGYHRSFGSGTDQTVYADLPYNTSSCNAGQAPNGDVSADGEVDTFSHELNEAITDPLSPEYAWSDSKGNEVGDMCGNSYGRAVGSTSPKDASGTEYNQVINGGRYYTQAEFSNLAFSKLGNGKGCALSEALAQNPGADGVGAQSTTVGMINNDATPWSLPADGTSTSKIVLGVADPQHNNVVGDHVHFTVGVESGTGPCGTLSSSAATTDSSGNATVTYTASTADVACWVLAVEALGGRSAESVVYQGTMQKASPTFKATYPTTLDAGGPTQTFTIVATNPSANPLPNTRVDFVIFPASATSKNVDAGQVHLSYSTTGANGPFTAVPLTGSTSDGAIQSFVGPAQGTTLPADSSETYTFHVGLAGTVPASEAAGPLISMEAYLDQVDDASGSGATLADTYAYDVRVPTAVQSSNTTRNILIAVAAVAAVAAAAGALVYRRRNRGRPGPPAQPATP
jgi:hypothetical protein